MPAEEQRKTEELRKAKEAEEEQRKADETRKAEELRKAKEAEELKRKQKEDARKAEEALKAKEAEELKRKLEEEEQRKADETRKAEELRKAREAEELKRKQEEEDRKAEEALKAKEAEELKRKLEEDARKAEELRKAKEAEELKRKQAKEDKEDQEESEKPHKKRRHQHQEEKPENSESQDDQVLSQSPIPVARKQQLVNGPLTQKQCEQLAKPVYEFFASLSSEDFNPLVRAVLEASFSIGPKAQIGLFWPSEDGGKRREFLAEALSLPEAKRTAEAATARRWIFGKMSDEVPAKENKKTKACREKRQELLKEMKGYLSKWGKLETTNNSDDNNETLDLMLECFKSPEMTQFLKDNKNNAQPGQKTNNPADLSQLTGNIQPVILKTGKRKQNPANKGTSSQTTSNHQEKNNKRKGPDTPSFSQPNANKQSVKPGIEEKINGSSQEGTSNMSSQKEKTTNEKDSGSNVDKNVAHSQPPVVDNTLPKPVGFSKQQNVEIRTNSQPPKATQAVKSQENKVQEHLNQATKKDQTENQVTVQKNVASQQTVSSGEKIHSSLLMVAEDYQNHEAEKKGSH